MPLFCKVYLLPAPFGGHYQFPVSSLSWLVSIWRRLGYNCSFNWWKIINLAKVKTVHRVYSESDPFLLNFRRRAISRCLMRFILFFFASFFLLFHYLWYFVSLLENTLINKHEACHYSVTPLWFEFIASRCGWWCISTLNPQEWELFIAAGLR